LDETEILTQKLQKENDAIVTLQIELAKLENIYATKKAKYDSISPPVILPPVCTISPSRVTILYA